jgi:hypothetical protein
MVHDIPSRIFLGLKKEILSQCIEYGKINLNAIVG